MPEVKDAVGHASFEPRSANGLRLVLSNGFQHLVLLMRVIFKIRVLDDDDITRHTGNACLNRRAFPLNIYLKNPNPFVLEPLKHIDCTVKRAVINDNDLPLKRIFKHPLASGRMVSRSSCMGMPRESFMKTHPFFLQLSKDS